MSEIKTHGMVVDFGKHKDQLWTRVPVAYLLWMVNSNHSRVDIAKAELARRGTVLPDMEISGHAIDRASLQCRKLWHESRGPEEGLHAWLVRVTGEAIKSGEKDDQGRYYYAGMRFVIKMDGCWPVLVTVNRKKKRNEHDQPR